MALTSDTSIGFDEGVPETGPDLASPAVLRELRDGLLFLLRREVADRALAEDLCNEAFRVLLERLARQPLEDPAKLAAYLAQTARNLATADRRKAARRRTVTGQQQAIEDFADAEPDPSAALQSQTRARAVHQVLKEMSTVRDRQLLVRYYLNDEDKADICRDLNLNKEHFNRVIFRARNRFRVLLDERYARGDLF